MGVYDQLAAYLAHRPGAAEHMSFAQVESLIGPLPVAARQDRAWWANDSTPQALAWRSAGWRVASVNQGSGEVIFARGPVDDNGFGRPPATPHRDAAPSADAAPAPTKKSRFLDLGPVWISAIGTLLGAIIAAVALLVANSGGGGGGTGTGTTVQSGTILPPADVAAHGGVCRQQLQIGADGNAGPLTCANGDVNELAWDYLAKNNLNVMSLGTNALPDQIVRAMCNDTQAGGSTNVVEVNAYKISAIYYGWNFGIDPSQEFMDGNC